jgi:hypothetical protein
MRKRIIYKFVSVLSIFLVAVSIFYNLLIFSHANGNEQSQIAYSKFDMYEYCKFTGAKENITSVDIELPGSNWNVTDINLNLTCISLKNETITIEDDETSFIRLMKSANLMMGSQINITEPTKIQAVSIFGYKSEINPAPAPIYVQINGWDSQNNIPNNTIYGERTLLNMIAVPDWNMQIFPSPIELSPGNYSIILNGTQILEDDKYYWYYNEASEQSELYGARYRDFGGTMEWRGAKGNIPLHKFTRWVNRTFNPSEINMTAEINNVNFTILDGENKGDGYVKVPNINISPFCNKLIIPINYNLSINLQFNLSYDINLMRNSLADGQVIMKENSVNDWSINLTIIRVTNNYSVIIYHPNDWDKIEVYRDKDLIPPEDFIVNDNYIKILNDTISDEVQWQIVAESLPIEFSIYLPTLPLYIAQDFEFSVEVPIIQGNISYILINSEGTVVDSKSKIVSTKFVNFSYLIKSNDHPGEWKVFVFWNNETAAGVVSQPFTVSGIPLIEGSSDENDKTSIVGELDPFIIIITIVITCFVILASIGTYIGINKYKSKKENLKMKMLNQYKDLFNLNNLIVISKSSGLNIYEKTFYGKDINPTLVSGFLEAIRNFGIEITDAQDISQTIKLEYKDSKIIMTDYKNFRLILIMRMNPSKDFINESIKSLSYEIEEKYGKLLKKFKGIKIGFEGLTDLLKIHLKISLISPLKINKSNIEELTQQEKELVDRALKYMKKFNSNHFYARDLLPEEIKDLTLIKTIINLIEKGIFIPII